MDYYAECIGYRKKSLKEFSAQLSKLTPEIAQAEAQIIESDNEIIADVDSEAEAINSQVKDIVLNESIFGSPERSNEGDNVADVGKINEAATNRSQEENDSEPKTSKGKKVVTSQQPKKKALVTRKRLSQSLQKARTWSRKNRLISKNIGKNQRRRQGLP